MYKKYKHLINNNIKFLKDSLSVCISGQQIEKGIIINNELHSVCSTLVHIFIELNKCKYVEYVLLI